MAAPTRHAPGRFLARWPGAPIVDRSTPPMSTPSWVFYRAGRDDGSFDAGIQLALERLLISPDFLFRVVRDPADAAPATVYTLTDLEIASRLSFFLWSSGPDDELLALAELGRLDDPAVLEQQTRRLLADPRATELVRNFAGQWLYLRNLRAVVPDAIAFPEFDENLRAAFQQETELFVESLIREDRSVLDLLGSGYTFVNERLAAHYGLPNVYGSHFRRVSLPPALAEQRGGIFGHGSVLTVTSYPNRTSPVLPRQVDVDQHSGHAAAPPAGRRARSAGTGRRWAGGHGPRPVAAASREPSLFGLPCADGPAWTGSWKTMTPSGGGV